MPRNGTGTYAPPAGQPVVTLTSVSSTVFNALVADLGAEVTKSVCTDGQTPMAANLPMGNNKITGLALATLSTDAARYDQLLNASAGEVSDANYVTLQAAATAAVGKTLRISGTWTLTAAVILDSNINVVLMPSALVTTATTNINLFSATGKTNVHFSGTGKMSQTVAGASAYVAAILLDTCTDCTVTGRIEFAGFQWCGVYMVNCLRCKVLGGYLHDWLGTVSDSGGVIIHQNSEDCIIDGVHCKATGWWGCLIQDPCGSGVYNPLRNKIRNSRIEGTTAYGAALYLGRAGNSYNEITDCMISGVLGTAGAGQYGMGVYAVGAGLGGCKLINISISDCCKNQTVTTNGYAGLVITGNSAGGYVKPIVSGISVDGMTQGGGIQVISMAGGCVVGPCSVNIPATNNGSGPGGISLLGQALYVWNCDNVTVSPGDYVNLGSGSAISVNASDANHSGITLNIGNARSASGNGVLVQRTAAYTITGSISGGIVITAADAATGMQLVGFSGPVSGVTVNNGTTGAATAALAISGCTNVRFSNMNVASTGTYSTSIGTSSGFWDKNSIHTGRFENSSATFKTEIYFAGIPTVGIFQIGDRAVNSNVVVGVAKAWSRETAGSAHVLGTDWISEGNL